jgi:hypothetical protein
LTNSHPLFFSPSIPPPPHDFTQKPRKLSKPKKISPSFQSFLAAGISSKIL